MSSPPLSSDAESDPERTAELPVLDPAAYAAAGEHRQSGTDTWVAPAPAARPAEAPPPAARPAEAPPPAGEARHARLTRQALSAKLRETQEVLASKDARLTQVEHARDEAHAARAAAEQSAAELNAELGQVRGELAFQLDELTGARARFDDQLAQARALLSAASARAAELQRRLEEQDSAAGTQRPQERSAARAGAGTELLRVAAERRRPQDDPRRAGDGSAAPGRGARARPGARGA